MFCFINIILKYFFYLLISHLAFINLSEATLSEGEFHQVIENFEQVFTPLIQKQSPTHWGLKILRQWPIDNLKYKSGLNAQRGGLYRDPYADGTADSYWIVAEGPEALRKLMSKISFELALCHELAHVFQDANIIESSSVSRELQADYFATSTCLPLLYKNRYINLISENLIQELETELPPFIVHLCRFHYSSNKEEVGLCLNMHKAIIEVSNYRYYVYKNVKFKLFQDGTEIIQPSFEYLDLPHTSKSSKEWLVQCDMENLHAGVLKKTTPLCSAP